MQITYDEMSESFLVLIEELQRGFAIPLNAVASISELLNYRDPIDCLEAIIQFRIKGTEGEADPITGENAWTAPHLLLEKIEKKREDEAVKIKEQENKAVDPRSTKLKVAFAMSKENQDRETLEKAQRDARKKLGVPEPKNSRVSAVRAVNLACSEESQCEGESVFCNEDRKTISQCLEPVLDKINDLKKRYCHSLTPNELDPLEEVEPIPEIKPLEAEDVLNRYR